MEEGRMNDRQRIFVYDTTLRDGQQGPGVDFTVEQKLRIVEALDHFGVDYIEGGWPGANPTDSAFFASGPKLSRARFTAFGMTRRAGRSAENDPTLAEVLNAGTPSVCLVGKAHPYHVHQALEISLDENLATIRDSIAHVAAQGREALFDAEHFFDGYTLDSEYALACLEMALEAGASWLVLCDTNGGMLPHAIASAVGAACVRFPDARIGIHTHDDAGLAVANSLAAIDAGARQVQGTLNGIGERCGNANLASILPTLVLKQPYRDQFETGISEEALGRLTPVSRLLDNILNQTPSPQAPYVGSTAFMHKAGLHVSAVAKHPDTYEHVEPCSVGNHRIIPMSRQAGRANVRRVLEQAGIDLDPDDERIAGLLDHVKALEERGFAFDLAEASFLLRAREYLGLPARFFDVERYRVSSEERQGRNSEKETFSEAVVIARVDGERRISASESMGEGDQGDRGPVNALARALRKDLGRHQAVIDGMRLVDYKVRILDTGTEAVTRVTIQSMDSKGGTWSTIGVSPNIVDASFQALVDSFNFALLRSPDQACAQASLSAASGEAA